jgi:hypothetical protein
MTLPLLSAQGKKKIKLFIGYGASVRWEVDASHQLSDPVLGVAIDACSFGPSFSIRHGCLPSLCHAFVRKTESTMVNKRLTLALSIWTGRLNSRSDGFHSMQEIGPLCCFRGRGTAGPEHSCSSSLPHRIRVHGIKHQAQAFSCARSHYP